MTTVEKFQIHYLSESTGKNFLRGLLSTGQCVPFIGAGFTAGEIARNGTVPSGKDFLDMMRNAINNSKVSEKPTADSISKYNFQQVADEYFREDIVSLEEKKTTLNNNFTCVKISSSAKKSFLRWGWDYIYTLNIDDAIERELDAIKVLPFTAFSQHKASQFVYKLHGDAADAVTANTKDSMRLIFGNADYIKSLISNRALISTLTNDLTERHLLFVGCSLTDEIDILFALAQSNSSEGIATKAKRVYVTSNEPIDYESKKRLRQYGITDVIVVDYAEFYSYVSIIENPTIAIKSPIEPFAYRTGKAKLNIKDGFLRYLLQIEWHTHEPPGDLAIIREDLPKVDALISEPIVVIWGRRLSGRTTMLFATLDRHTNRKRFFLPSSSSASDLVVNAIFNAKDCLIAIDSGAMSYQQIKDIVRKSDQIEENNTTVILSMSRSSLSALGPLLSESSLEVQNKMSASETLKINNNLEQFGTKASWISNKPHLENIFTLSKSTVVRSLIKSKSKLTKNIERLHDLWSASNTGKLEFSVLYYLGNRQRIYSRHFRELAKGAGLEHLANNHFDDFGRQWEPFIEIEDSDTSSKCSERSLQVLVSNSSAWIRFSIQQLSLKLGAKETSSQIVRTFEIMNKVEDKAFELLMFDNLNDIFSESLSDLRVSVIRGVYEQLSSTLAINPDYWLQRAKSLYYLSNSVDELLVGVEYCEKSIVKRGQRTSTNSKLTKANLLGKICKIKPNPSDSDLLTAINAYVEAIESRSENPMYIDELLRKSTTGKGYMSLVCKLASQRASLLPNKEGIDFIRNYVAGRF